MCGRPGHLTWIFDNSLVDIIKYISRKTMVVPTKLLDGWYVQGNTISNTRMTCEPTTNMYVHFFVCCCCCRRLAAAYLSESSTRIKNNSTHAGRWWWWWSAALVKPGGSSSLFIGSEEIDLPDGRRRQRPLLHEVRLQREQTERRRARESSSSGTSWQRAGLAE